MPKTNLSSLTLATLLCLSMGMLASSAHAATKSAISPEIQTGIQLGTSAPSALPDAIEPINLPIDNTAPHREGIQIQIEGNSNLSLPERSPSAAPSAQPVEIVLENRSTGCKFTANSLLERDNYNCNADGSVRLNNASSHYGEEGSVLYAARSGNTAIELRQLTEQEIAAMSLPSNGDKQMLFPLIIPSVISSIFGERVHPITGKVTFHQGTDLAAPEGTPVVAAFSGYVEVSGWVGGYGLMVVISHGDTHETRYAHLSEVLVKPGQKVKQGTVIGLVGSTGMATGPHLHFEIWRKLEQGMVAINPTPQLMLAMEQLQKYLAQSPRNINKV
ncbi:MAG: M23 family metallopeptidase [Pseudanabaenaceae cyanobacterium bins.39]|nr:M23 family metallopeptidase [Pseudanabaenaceae cyanobacterium bins.39]